MESLVSDISAGDGNIVNLFYSVYYNLRIAYVNFYIYWWKYKSYKYVRSKEIENLNILFTDDQKLAWHFKLNL
jgi:hypothetical protein